MEFIIITLSMVDTAKRVMNAAPDSSTANKQAREQAVKVLAQHAENLRKFGKLTAGQVKELESIINKA